ncbi:hypothetical protein Glove_272g29 [Diversispora epigaea]|uniref:RNase H type-1 domain-containing protein n=1 Tax=Diversispora epigaea TaxID=1348612 RepID=A0A397IAD5_9GLOM|nr:hypothetical protein Glove_272g29 [Diversispora epigaea]
MDDTVWIANDKTSMEKILKTAEEFFDITGIQINAAKSDLIVIRNRQNAAKEHIIKQGIKFAGTIIKPTKPQDGIRYLGIWVSEDGRKEHQINLIRTKLKTAISLLRFKHLTDKQIRYLINQVIFPRIEYLLTDLILTDTMCSEINRSVKKIFKQKCGLAATFPDSFIYSQDGYRLFNINDRQLQMQGIEFTQRLNSDNNSGKTTRIRRYRNLSGETIKLLAEHNYQLQDTIKGDIPIIPKGGTYSIWHMINESYSNLDFNWFKKHKEHLQQYKIMYTNQLLNADYEHAIEFNTEIPRPQEEFNTANNITILSDKDKVRGKAVLWTKHNEIVQGKIYKKPATESSKIIIKHLINEVIDEKPTSILQPCQGFIYSQDGYRLFNINDRQLQMQGIEFTQRLNSDNNSGKTTRIRRYRNLSGETIKLLAEHNYQLQDTIKGDIPIIPKGGTYSIWHMINESYSNLDFNWFKKHKEHLQQYKIMYTNQLLNADYEHAIEFNTEIPRPQEEFNTANNITILSDKDKVRGKAVLWTKHNEIVQGKIYKKPATESSKIIIKHLINEVIDEKPTSILQPCQGCHLSEESKTQKAKYNQSGIVKNCITSADSSNLRALPITEVCYSKRRNGEKKRRAQNQTNTRENEEENSLNNNIILAPTTTMRQIEQIGKDIEEFQTFQIYTDGSLTSKNEKKRKREKAKKSEQNKNIDEITPVKSRQMGIGVIIQFNTQNHETYTQSIGAKVSGAPISSTRAELWAILLAIKLLPAYANAQLFTDSQASIDAIKTFANPNMTRKTRRYKNLIILKAIRELILQKQITIEYIKVKAHKGNKGNNEVDKLAKWGAKYGEELCINHQIINDNILHKWNNNVIDLPIRDIIRNNIKTRHYINWTTLNRNIKWNNKFIQRETDWRSSFQLIHETNITNPVTSNIDHRNRKFGIKLLNDELPTKSLLHERRPDLYTDDTCVSCNKAKENSLHVFICKDFINILQKSFLHNIVSAIIKIKGECKKQQATQLLTKNQTFTIDISRQIGIYNQQARFSFVDIIRGLIPKTLNKLLRKFVNNLETKHTIQTTFLNLREQKWEKWLKRYEEFLEWEKEQTNITKEAKLQRKKNLRIITDEYKCLKQNLRETADTLTHLILNKIYLQGHDIHDLSYNIDECGVLTSSE